MANRDRRLWRVPVGWTLASMAMALSGCASYAPKPLSERTDLAPSVDRRAVADAKAAAKAKSGLGLEKLAALAVRNNPDLKAKRKRMGVANAQLYAAGLLPDPQLSANLDSPTGASGAKLVTAYGVGLGYDIIPLVTRGARVRSERQAAAQVGLELLWEEWQVNQQARALAVRWASERAQLALLERMRDLYRKRYRLSEEALRHGNLTVDVAGTDLTALLDTLSRLNQIEQSHNVTEYALRLLLGLAPEAPLAVEVPPPPPPEALNALPKLLPSLPARRPDLLALQAGYGSQEAKVHAAILSQFPSFSIGISRARDTGSVYTSGINVGLNLPLFSGNRGAIAIERATREQLHKEYQARLNQAVVDIDKLTRLQGIVAAQQGRLDEYLPTLGRMVEQARTVFDRQDIDALTFLNMQTT